MAPTDGGTSDAEDAEVVAGVLQAIANPNRLRLLQGLYQDQSRADLVEALPISGSGVTNHLRRLEEAGLVYRGEGGWTLSPLGVFFAVFLDEHLSLVATAVRRIESAAEEAEQEYAEVEMPDDQRERTVEWRKWELVRGELEDLLEEAQEGFEGT